MLVPAPIFADTRGFLLIMILQDAAPLVDAKEAVPVADNVVDTRSESKCARCLHYM